MRSTQKIFSIFFLLLALILLPSPSRAAETFSLNIAQGIYQYDKAYQVLELVNQERAKEGLNPLVMDRDLLSAAMIRAAETNVYFDHTRPNGESCYTACSKMYGENIAGGSSTAAGVMNQWMNSPGHRSNILSSGFSTIGIGCFTQGGITFWVQAFGTDSAAPVSQPENRTVNPVIQVLPSLISLSFRSASPVSVWDTETVTVGVRSANMGWQGTCVELDPCCLSFSSSNSTAVTVDQGGTLRMNQGGSSTITVSLTENPSINAYIKAETYCRFQDASIPELPDAIYTGNPIAPSPTVTYKGKTLLPGIDYLISYSNNTETGRASVTFTGCGLYKGTISRYFYINKLSISDADLQPITPMVYDGTALIPELSITYQGVPLTKGIDYNVSCDNNIHASRYAKIIITGIGKYTGTLFRYFTIRPMPLSGETCTFRPTSPLGSQSVYDYIEKYLTIQYQGKTLTSDDYFISSAYMDSTELLSFQIQYWGDYQGSCCLTSIKSCSVGSIKNQTYTGASITPSVSVKNGKILLKAGTDYTVSYSKNEAVGTATVEITGKGLYFGSVTANFKILQGSGSTDTNPSPGSPVTPPAAPVLKARSAYNKITLTWNVVSNADGYVIYRKTGSSSYQKIKTITSGRIKTYTDTKVNFQKSYRYMIKAYKKKSGCTVYSTGGKTLSAKPNLTRPTLTLKTIKGKQTLSWKKVAGASGYFIYLRKGTGTFRRIKTLSSKYIKYTLRTTRKTLYSYKIVPYRTVRGVKKIGPSSLVKKARAL